MNRKFKKFFENNVGSDWILPLHSRHSLQGTRVLSAGLHVDSISIVRHLKGLTRGKLALNARCAAWSTPPPPQPREEGDGQEPARRSHIPTHRSYTNGKEHSIILWLRSLALLEFLLPYLQAKWFWLRLSFLTWNNCNQSKKIIMSLQWYCV